MKNFNSRIIQASIWTVLLGVFLCLPAQVDAAVITVDSAADTEATDGECTLREAINNANSDLDTTGGDCVDGFGPDQIQFNIGGGGAQMITVASDLPLITSEVEIDGETQPATGGCLTKDLTLTLATATQDLSGFTFGAGSEGSTLRGFIIGGFVDDGDDFDGDTNNAGVVLNSQITLECNIIGLNNSSTVFPNTNGVKILGTNNNIGTLGASVNVISGNTDNGILIESGANNNIIRQNLIGTDKSGIVARANGIDGISVNSNNNTIGGTVGAGKNTISGNIRYGVYLNGESNTVSGNYIGVNSTGGATGVGNEAGVYTVGNSNTIGGSGADEGNLISSNDEHGLYLNSSNNVVYGNYIGVDRTGTNASPNGTSSFTRAGVVINASNNTVGGPNSGERNIISGNNRYGILVYASSNTIQGNYIGVDAAGTTAVANQRNGINIQFGATSNIIGGSNPGEGNLISGNASEGVLVFGEFTDLKGNYIGVDAAGTSAIPNGNYGLNISTGNNTIGGTSAGDRNIISGNDNGLLVSAFGTPNTIQGNYIGIASDGSALGNAGVGLYMGSDGTIGGATSNARNIISANGTLGLFISAQSVSVLGNYIGVNSAGNVEAGFGNGHTPDGSSEAGGILARASSTATIGGTSAGTGNVIAGNQGSGVIVSQQQFDPTNSISILGNSIFENTGLGIDLSYDSDFDYIPDADAGNNPNDAGDADTGANDYLNYIEVTEFTETAPGQYTIDYDLDVPAGDYTIEFFSNPAADASGFGEAKTFVARTDINHTGSGSESFSANLTLSENDYLSATVTQLLAPLTYGKTSELSAAELITNTAVIVSRSFSSGSTSSQKDYKSPFAPYGEGDTGTPSAYELEIQSVIDAGLVTDEEEPNTPADKCEALLIMSRYYKWEVPESDTTPFNDVPEWCVSLSNYGYEIGVVEGIQPGVLGMGRDMMRYEFVVMLYRFLEAQPADIQNPFSDNLVPWAETAVLWSYDKQVVKGYDNGTFGGEDNILKQDLAIILNRFSN